MTEHISVTIVETICDQPLQLAAPDEPMFVLLARDPLAPDLLREWADRKLQSKWIGRRITRAKIAEAMHIADAMEEWRRANPPERKP